MPDRETDLALRALAVNQANLALGHDVFTADGATFVRNVKYPRIYDANHVANVTASTPGEIAHLLRRVETEFAHCARRRFHVAFRTPPAFEARLQFDGYDVSHSLVMLLEGDLPGAPKPCDIGPVDSDAAWAAVFALHQMDWNEYAARTGAGGDETVGIDMARTQRLKSPPVRYWLAYADGEPRGYLNAWEGIDGVGQIESLFVQTEYRHRGIATGLIHHCVADASDTPKRIYAAMGFRPVAVKREYLKTL